MRAVRRVVLRAIFTWYRRRAGHTGKTGAQSGAVCAEQRFSSSSQLNVHLHALVLDGVYSSPSPNARPRWHPAPPPTDDDVARLCRSIAARVVRLLRARGLLKSSFDGDEQPSLLTLIAAASVQGKSALSAEAGSGVGRLGDLVEHPASPVRHRAPLCADHEGFSLHAGVCVPAGERDRERLEHLCRYVARPPLSSERLSLSRRGNVLLRLRRPWRDGTTHLVFEPLVFLERLAALIQRPRVHQVTYHAKKGSRLAPAAALRDQVVPAPPSRRPRGEGFAAAACSAKYSWAELMKRVFIVDVLRCHHCGNRRQLIALITQASIIRRTLGHLGLDGDPPPIAPADAPPQLALPC